MNFVVNKPLKIMGYKERKGATMNLVVNNDNNNYLEPSSVNIR